MITKGNSDARIFTGLGDRSQEEAGNGLAQKCINSVMECQSVS